MRVAVTGAGGQLGRDLAIALEQHDAILLPRSALDVTDPAAVGAVLRAAKPDAIVHAAAWTDVDGCEADPERARLVNVLGTQNVVESAGNTFVVVVSTDYVFDGTLGRAYDEDDATAPLQTYGRTKSEAEQIALSSGARVAIARSAWLYGASTAAGEPARSFVRSILLAAQSGPLDVVDDQVGSPTATSDLARALVKLVEEPATGIFHVANVGAVSRAEFARAVLHMAERDPMRVRPVATADAPRRPARRPAYAPLEGRRWGAAGFYALPPWEDALARTLPDILAAL